MRDGVVVGEIKDSGIYTVTATFAPLDPANNEIVSAGPDGTYALTVTYVVGKKPIGLSDIVFPNASAEYDGTPKSCAPANVNADLLSYSTVYYPIDADGNPLDPVTEMINAGRYYVVTSFTLVDDKNYYILGDASKAVAFEITKKPIDLSAVAFPEINYTPYNNGAPIVYELVNLPEGVTAFYTYNDSYDPMSAIGEYRVVAYLYSDNYAIPAEYSAISTTFVVQQKISLDGITFGPVMEAVYTGNPIVPELMNLPNGVVPCFVYEDADGNLYSEIVNAGEYTVHVTFARDGDVYYCVDPTYRLPEATFTILPQTVMFEFSDGTAVYDGTAKTHTGLVFALPADASILYTSYSVAYMGEHEVLTPGELLERGTYRVEATLIGDNYVFANGTRTVRVNFEIS